MGEPGFPTFQKELGVMMTVPREEVWQCNGRGCEYNYLRIRVTGGGRLLAIKGNPGSVVIQSWSLGGGGGMSESLGWEMGTKLATQSFTRTG
jgi:hypothetical protein